MFERISQMFKISAPKLQDADGPNIQNTDGPKLLNADEQKYFTFEDPPQSVIKIHEIVSTLKDNDPNDDDSLHPSLDKPWYQFGSSTMNCCCLILTVCGVATGAFVVLDKFG